ncbi:polysaccharide pyruvyl transferase family protein [Motilimonas sp. KMU-193]|uniref:polysaccharide pyruvyl transferase family protein n=1 Tax=Motilimonas sp. KMU-193 TaxID=3388668 RepID=UPI00396B31B3
MKVLLVGNHSCSNRGDAAITRGLLESLKDYGYDINVYSRYPIGASSILGVSVLNDPTKVSSVRNNFFSKVINKICWKLNADPIVLLMLAAYYIPYLKSFLPENIKLMIDDMKKSDRIIQVGGSFFVDLYGLAQYRLMLCAILAGKPIYLIGHSLGPFNGWLYKKVSGWCFGKAEGIIIRDDVSRSEVETNFPKLNFSMGADTAWLVVPNKIGNKKDTVAITVRHLSPFDKRLGISQNQYETNMAELCEYLIEKGFNVNFYSTCTSFDGYHNDDRLVAKSIKERIQPEKKEFVDVIMDELDDVQLGEEFSQCKFTIGTRLHSCIISMNFGTPAIAIGYEHKSKGLYSAMKLNDCIVDLDDFNLDALKSIVESFIDNTDFYNERYINEVIKQRSVASSAIDKILGKD